MRGTSGLVFATVVVVVAAILGATRAAARRGDTALAKSKPFKVTSTLDGKAVLPYRMRWLASPRLPGGQVKEARRTPTPGQ